MTLDNEIRQNQILRLLDGDDEQFKFVLDKLIKKSIRISRRVEAIQEELYGQDKLCQICVEDIGFNFWFQNKNGKVYYDKGIIENPTASIFLPKNILIKIIQQKITGSEAFMQGIIKIKGKVRQVVNFRNSLQVFLKYLQFFKEDA